MINCTQKNIVPCPHLISKRLLALSILFFGFVAPIFAQGDFELEEVIVRGIQSSLSHSVEIKRDSIQLKEVVTSDDIGEMPDQNIADALQRLAGIQVDRRDGIISKVRIRGLDQNITLLNGGIFTSGMEYYQLNEWQQEYSYSLESVPSDLLGSAEVYKTPTANLVEGGVGGAINLKTLRGFDIDELLLAVNLSEDFGKYSRKPKPSGYFVLGNNFNNEFAGILTVASSNRVLHTDIMQNFSRGSFSVKEIFRDNFGDLFDPRPNDKGNLGGSLSDNHLITDLLDPEYIDTSATGFDPDYAAMINRARSANVDGSLVRQTYMVPNMWYVMDTEQERGRVGSSLNLEWRPVFALDIKFDWFHSKLNINNIQYSVKHEINGRNSVGIDLREDYVLDETKEFGVIQSASFSMRGAETNAAGETVDAKADNYALEFLFDKGGSSRFSISLRASNARTVQRAGFGDSQFGEYAMRAYDPDRVVYDSDSDGLADSVSPTGWWGRVVNPSPYGDNYRSLTFQSGKKPGLNYINSAWLSDPRFHTYKSHWALGSDVEQNTYAFHSDAEWDFDFKDLQTLSFGLRVAEEEVTFDELRWMVNYSTTTDAQQQTRFDGDGSVAEQAFFNSSLAPDETNAGLAEAVYYDLCNNGGIPEGNICDINGDGYDDNQPYGPWGYYQDANIGSKVFDLRERLYLIDIEGNPVSSSIVTSFAAASPLGSGSGVDSDKGAYVDRPMSVVMLGIDTASSGERWRASPGIIPWQTFTPHTDVLGATGDQDPSRYIKFTDFFPSGGYDNSIVVFQNGQKIVEDVQSWIQGITPNSAGQWHRVPTESWNIEQSTSAFYGMADFEGGSVPYKLNAGIRIVKTNVEVTSYEAPEGAVNWLLSGDSWNGPGVILLYEEVISSTDYWDTLPSLNFSLDTGENTKLRFAAAKVLARPDLHHIGKGFERLYTRVPDPAGGAYYAFQGGAGGNPDLEPYRATQADLVYEWYTSDMGLISLGIFKKDIKSFIAERVLLEWAEDEGPGGGRLGSVTRPFNGTGGSVTGLEFIYQEAWDSGWGVIFNYTYSDSDYELPNNLNLDIGLPGMSLHSFNLAGFYENEFFSARLTYSWRDEYLSPYRPVFAVQGYDETISEFYRPYGQLDASIRWDFASSFSFIAELANITGETESSYIAYSNQPMTYSAHEPRVHLGISYRL